MYAPAIAREVLRQNAQPANKDKQINLKGIALGNGWCVYSWPCMLAASCLALR
jgi:carboxypeptidase C (cathepsin A)